MVEKVGALLTKIFDHIKMIGIYFFATSALSSAVWSMIAVDVSSIDAKVTAVAAGNQILVEVIAYKVPPNTAATMSYRIDGKEVLHHHYPALPDGKKVQSLPLPLEYNSEVRVDIIITLEGFKTLFTDNDIKYTQYVVVGG